MQLRQPLAGLLLLTVATLLGLSPEARAADWARASHLLRTANQQCAGKQPEAALATYEEALRAKELPQIHLAYGECLRQLGKCDRALEQFRRYQQMVRSRKNREQAQALIKLCEEELETAAAAAAAQAATLPAEQSSSTEQPPDLAATQPAAAPAPRPKSRRRLRPLWFWTGVGVTAALLAAGTACGVVAMNKSDRFKDPSTPDSELQGLKDTGEAMKLTSTITFAVGGAAAVATTVLFFYTRFKPSETVSAAPVPGGALLVMGGRF